MKTFRPESREVDKPKATVLFGVGWDQPTIQVLNAIIMDVLSYQRLVPNSAKLVVVCDDAAFLERVSGALRVEVSDSTKDKNACTVWKLYYVVDCPPSPPQAEQCYSKQVTNLEVKRLVMRQGQPRYPSLVNPGDNRMVPPGKSPNINKIPPHVPYGQPSTLYQPF